MVQRKTLLVAHDALACGCCERTLLTGEHVMFFHQPSGDLGLVCELCERAALRSGWTASQEPWRSAGRLSIAEAVSRLRDEHRSTT